MRAFVAVEISDETRNELATLIAELGHVDAPLKWVAPQNIHLTLKFLGNVPDESVTKAIEIMKKCCEGVAPFRLEVKGVGGFPDLRRPRVLFVDAVDEPATAASLARRLNKEMTRAGVPKEDRPFRSHLTIGRVRRPRPLDDVAKKLERVADKSFGTTDVERIVLMKSDLTSAGPIYTPVEYGILRG